MRDLGDGLVMRRATPDDTEAVAEHNAIAHSDGNEPNEYTRRETREMMSGRHPNIGAGDFAVVEDTGTGQIVSSLCLISHEWSYGSIPFGVGQIELVGTLPEYRGKGLVRALMDVMHGWSKDRGQKANFISGIPHYYRQFGYEYAIYAGGGRSTQGDAPKLKAGEEEPFTFRPFHESDAPFITRLWQESSGRYLVDTVIDNASWPYHFLRRQDHSGRCRIIEIASGEPIGCFVHPDRLWGRAFSAFTIQLLSDVSWVRAVPSILRYLEKTGQEYAEERNVKEPEKDPITLETIGFFGIEPGHPAYQATEQLLPIERRQWGLYVRVPDIPGFIQHIGPVLEQRLADSIMSGHTGETKVSFANGGFQMRFDQGTIAEVEPWGPTRKNGWDDKGRNALFPDLTFLKLLFGFRSVDELRYAFPDVQAGSETRTLLEALFPKQPSRIQFV